ncbi:hypothetical protein [Streptomyces xanthophaeus]|uniref:hypothetical protein n=1 Tax=Streptomyces xanthophaeus TaxID=67385 RepID=UPI0026494D50|nr:hypothetical protein [Streptomyces xanthophaeus]
MPDDRRPHDRSNRPRRRNAQNSAMTYALDDAFYRAAEDDAHLPFERRAGLWWDHTGRPGAESRCAREPEVCLGMCRRRRELPKPVTSSGRGACAAGGLMPARVCDLIVASEDEVGLHHLAHAHDAETAGDSLGGIGIAALKEANT